MSAPGRAGESRRNLLAANAAELHDLLRFGQLNQLVVRLHWIRRSALAWVKEPAASRIVASLDECLRLIGLPVRR